MTVPTDTPVADNAAQDTTGQSEPQVSEGQSTLETLFDDFEQGQSGDEPQANDGQSDDKNINVQEGGQSENIQDLPTENWEEKYKLLQTDFQSRNEVSNGISKQVKEMGFNTPEEMINTVSSIINRPSFKSWAEQERAREVSGTSYEDEMSEEQVRGATAARNLISSEVRAAIAPYERIIMEEKASKLIKELDNDSDIGDFWRDNEKEMMSEINKLSFDKRKDLDSNELAGLFWKTSRQKGTSGKYYNLISQNEIRKSQTRSTEKPSVGKSIPGKIDPNDWDAILNSAVNSARK